MMATTPSIRMPLHEAYSFPTRTHRSPTSQAEQWRISSRGVHRSAVRVSRATLCYVKEITHREMRNHSADVLRQVTAGETFLVTNNGRPAAVIGPPPGDTLALLSAQGQLRRALSAPADLRSIERKTSGKTTAEIIADARGRW